MQLKIGASIDKIFLTKDKVKMAQWRVLNGCPESVDAAYDGYTGIKMYRFPTNSKYKPAHYPDVTANFHEYRNEILRTVQTAGRKTFGKIRELKLFLDNFATGGKWDTKFNMYFPGRDGASKVQYARYEGQVVSGNFLSNNIYGFLCAAIGIPEKMSKFIAKVYSCGALEPLIYGKLPNKKLMKFRDPVSDQKAITDGYKDYKKLMAKI